MASLYYGSRKYIYVLKTVITLKSICNEMSNAVAHFSKIDDEEKPRIKASLDALYMYSELVLRRMTTIISQERSPNKFAIKEVDLYKHKELVEFFECGPALETLKQYISFTFWEQCCELRKLLNYEMD